VGFMGSLNLLDRSYRKPANLRRGLKWQELVTRVEGPVVRAMSAVFLSDWYSETGVLLTAQTQLLAEPAGKMAALPASTVGDLDCQVVPSGPGFDNDNNLKLFNSLLYQARRRVSITSPYFVPDESLISAITTAAERGVAVELFVGEVADQPMVFHAQRSYYEVLLRAGVRIYLYPAPYILHAKHLTIDDDLAVIGSSNMDMRSFGLNLEVTLMASGRSYTDAMRGVEDHYRSVSRELTLDEHLHQGILTRLFDNLARLTSALQ
ncbi:MAG TPA: phospholipase D-like domain-containing protein, partial [Propionicimonas sp.]|nr:phospholipase D-like domain-containing protein [Propionicimonas sp.]